MKLDTTLLAKPIAQSAVQAGDLSVVTYMQSEILSLCVTNGGQLFDLVLRAPPNQTSIVQFHEHLVAGLTDSDRALITQDVVIRPHPLIQANKAVAGGIAVDATGEVYLLEPVGPETFGRLRPISFSDGQRKTPTAPFINYASWELVCFDAAGNEHLIHRQP